jgi:hypothetical protein
MKKEGSMNIKSRLLVAVFVVVFGLIGYGEETSPAIPGLTCRISYDSEADILSDFLSAAKIYRSAKPGTVLENPLKTRHLSLTEGRFGRALHIEDGWSVTKGTANESGIDLDLIVATLWGDYRTKPHYWGAGKFFGGRGTVAFWVKRKAILSDPLYPVFLQSSIAWGRKERDLFRVDISPEGRLSASVRDIFYNYHRVESGSPVWVDNEWQHVAVTFDQAYGLTIYHNGRPVASNWGKDAWWQTPLPGLFSPFLPEAWYDEICLFDYPLDEDQVRALWSSNAIPEKRDLKRPLDEAAARRLILSYADVESLDLPVCRAGTDGLSLRQARVADCHDENIPAWWVMDGRYELAWPHPYLLFTFILGDVDFHGTKLDIDLAPGEKANYLSLEGVLDGTEVYPGTYRRFVKARKIADLAGYPGSFYSTRLDLGDASSLHFPMLKGYGTPAGLIDRGTLKFPLTGKIRLHEIQLWEAVPTPEGKGSRGFDFVWPLRFTADPGQLDVRYLDAFLKLAGAENRSLFLGSTSGPPPDIADLEIPPLETFHIFSPDLNPDPAIAKIGLGLTVIPEGNSDVLWLKLRDPANPGRIWANAVIRLEFREPGKSQEIRIDLDPIDLMLASEDRLWLELKFARRERIVVSSGSAPWLAASLSRDREKSLADYTAWELRPAEMQYIKEYNYQPWLFTGEQRNVSTLAFPGGPIPMSLSFISGQGQSLKFWTNFGGPYDMWYPPQAVLRHDPKNRLAGIYSRLTGERAQTYGAYADRYFTPTERIAIAPDIPPDAPAWAVWERELFRRHLRTVHWIVDQQRQDGFFWGGYKDDVFIPMGYADVPLMGDEKTRRSFLRLYDGVDDVGAFKDGYCDIWPNDYLHITDILVSRGLMVPYALGDPYVLEREMVTARVYTRIMEQNNAARASNGLPPFVLTPESSKTEPRLWGEQIIRDYETTQVLWYWGKTPAPEPHRLIDREEAARKMMTIATSYDETEEYEWTRAMRHTDKQGGAPGRNELVTAALGGRLQGRIEPHPHSMVVSWDNPDPDIARLVTLADEKTTRFNVFNFKSAPQKLKARLWRIPDGVFLLEVGEDGDDDGLPDPEKRIHREERLRLGRFSTIDLVVPPQQNIAVALDLVEAAERPATLPDLAVHPQKDIRSEGEKLIVKIHNIGDAPSGNFTAEVLDESGRMIDRQVIAGLPAPLDFVPKTVEVVFDLSGRKWHKVVIDGENAIAELFEGNNVAAAPSADH